VGTAGQSGAPPLNGGKSNGKVSSVHSRKLDVEITETGSYFDTLTWLLGRRRVATGHAEESTTETVSDVEHDSNFYYVTTGGLLTTTTFDVRGQPRGDGRLRRRPCQLPLRKGGNRGKAQASGYCSALRQAAKKPYNISKMAVTVTLPLPRTLKHKLAQLWAISIIEWWFLHYSHFSRYPQSYKRPSCELGRVPTVNSKLRQS
jgi:hypothetical protein